MWQIRNGDYSAILSALERIEFLVCLTIRKPYINLFQCHFPKITRRNGTAHSRYYPELRTKLPKPVAVVESYKH